ncbi:hypothetical protein GF336_03990 [Candidatus Woesearchaeota archaeon]|nr:hypothetical protein [Candidatus Woesearchaeota archaeon]
MNKTKIFAIFAIVLFSFSIFVGAGGAVGAATFGIGTAAAGTGYGGFALGGAIAGFSGGRSTQLSYNLMNEDIAWNQDLANAQDITLETGGGALFAIGGKAIGQLLKPVASNIAGRFKGMSRTNSNTNTFRKMMADKSGSLRGKGGRVVNVRKPDSPIWKNILKNGRSIKSNPQYKRVGKRIYKWDNLHNEIEVFDDMGKHMGAQDPLSGAMYKPAVKGRVAPRR